MLDQEAIKQIIPHRDPFLLLDEIHDLIPLKKAKGVRKIKVDEDYFKGHFPKEPVMPGVLIIEAMAQVGAVVVLSSDKYKGQTAYFVGADNVKFRRKVKPGDTLMLECEVVKIRRGYGLGQGRAFVDGELAAEGMIKFALE